MRNLHGAHDSHGLWALRVRTLPLQIKLPVQAVQLARYLQVLPFTGITCCCIWCRHVFCDTCLRAAVKAQKKCPTCRKNMACRQIHRVYLNVS